MDLTTVFSSLMSGCIPRPIGVNLRRNLRLFFLFFFFVLTCGEMLYLHMDEQLASMLALPSCRTFEPWRLTTTLPHDLRHVTGWALGSDTPPMI